MNFSLISLEIAVVILALGVLLGDLWTPAQHKRKLGYAAAAGLLLIFIFSIFARKELFPSGGTEILADYAFGKMFVVDGLATFFKQFFILAALFVIIMAAEFADRIKTGIAEFYSLILMALAGMLFASSANDFVLVFVALELITITFYILNSFQRNRISSLEAGIKYLILGAVSTAFFVFGLAFVFGISGTTNFSELHSLLSTNPVLGTQPLFLAGLFFIFVGLAFKLAAFPMQVWAPDVYQGSPAPATAFLAVGSKAAGIVLLLRVLFIAVPQVALEWTNLLIGIAAITILYGNLCAIPQRNLKRLMGYSSIANAGYLLLGFAALTRTGSSAVLYYLAGYLFTVIAAFTVIVLVTRQQDSDDITVLAGLGRRSPFLAAALTLAMVSLAGIPPLAGFFGKFLLLKAVVEQGASNTAYYVLVGVAIAGVVMSLYYYFGVIRAIYWSRDPNDLSPIAISIPTRLSLGVCMAGMLYLGVNPEPAIQLTKAAVKVLNIGI
ncbi:MAG: NADH-quinone oxidoreductase subunit N [Verrucomicrobia bacterium]|nr:NADH-quinone oxidoreductase subunit N [Verrucomicrobiota bacterium]